MYESLGPRDQWLVGISVSIFLAIFTTIAVIVVPLLFDSGESPSTVPAESPGLSASPERSPVGTSTGEHAPSQMSQARANVSLVMLNDGKVLAVGSFEFAESEKVRTTEIYDPMSGEWRLSGSLNERRLVAPAVRLQDGTVLVAGGSEVDITRLSGFDRFPTPLRSAEIYDPTSGQWLTTGSMVWPRYLHTLSLLPDGRVLAVGGQGAGSSAEIYEPRTGRWRATSDPELGDHFGFMGHIAVTLADGRVLVAGGKNTPVEGWGNFFDEAAIYDPDGGEWAVAANMAVGVERGVAVPLADGRVLVTGGRTGTFEENVPASNVVQIYDPASDRWELTSPMAVPRIRHVALRLLDGLVLVAGGLVPVSQDGSDTIVPTDSVEIYDPDNGNWSLTKEMNSPRAYHAAVVLPGGEVLIAGSAIPVAAQSAELYTP